MEKERILENVINYLSQHDIEKPFIKGQSEVPVSGGELSYFDIMNVIDAALDGWITEGKWADRFRKALASYTGYNHAVLCNSGSSANLLALSAMVERMGLKKGDSVITSALAFPTTVAPIIQAGLIPCFIDINIDTLNPEPYHVSEAINMKESIVGVILSHTLGFPYDAREIDRLCKDNNLFFIQDQCDALGAKLSDGTQLSEFGNIGTLSFFPAHQLTTGEGGAVLCNDGRLMRIIESYSNWGRDCWCRPGENNVCGKRFEYKFNRLPEGYDHKYITSRVGYNMKMTELQAALGMSQVNRIQQIVTQRRFNFTYLRGGLKRLPKFNEYFTFFREPILSSPFGLPMMTQPWVEGNNSIIKFLDKNKIRTRPIFAGNITKQPMMEKVTYNQVGDLHNCDRVMNNAFWLGVHPELSTEQLDYVIESFADFLGRVQ